MEELIEKSKFKSYLLFWSGQLFSLMGSLIVQFVITWWITLETGSPTFLSIGMFLYFLPMIVITPIAGVVSDRWDRKKIIIIVDSLQALITVWIIFLFYLNRADPLLVILINSLRGITQAFHLPTVSSVIPSMVPKEKLSRINGINYLFTSLINIVGPMIAAVVLAFFPIRMILWLDVISFGIAMIPLLIVRIPRVNVNEQQEVKEKESFRKEFKEGIITIKLIPGLMTILLLSMVLNFLIMPMNVLMPYFVKVTHEGNPGDLALIMGGFNVGMVLGALITSVKKKWDHKIFVYFTGLMVVMGSISVLGLAPKGFFLLIAGVAVITGISLPIVNTIYMTIGQTVVPADKMGRVSSVDQSLSMAISPIGTIISGPLAEIFGINNLFIYCALIGVVITFITWRFSKVRSINYDDANLLNEITASIANIKT
jgi:DHA3 family macrolide efflux protein-like MFS transporter